MWEEEVGKHSRAAERTAEQKAAADIAEYHKTVELLKRRQAQE